MKKIIAVLCAICICVPLSACNVSTASSQSDKSQSTAKGLAAFNLSDENKTYGTTFGQGETTDVYVEISDDDWQAMLDKPTAEEYYSADVTVNGTTVNNVGFRTKGFSSLTSVAQSDSERYGFKIKTDKYVDNQTINGLDMLVLNANFSDPSYMREYLTYAASMYLGGITPYVSYSRLYINNELYGLYMTIEAYKDSFVERNTDDDNAVLYKADSENCTLLSSDDGSGFTVEYGKDDENSNIKSLISVLDETTADNKDELEKILDTDSVLKSMAINTVMGNYDSYSGSKAHNYYLLYSDGTFKYIGWDYNMSIGGFSEDNGASVTADVNTAVYNTDLSKRPLIEKLLNIDEYKQKYLDYVNTLMDYFDDFQSTVNKIADVIRSDVEADPTAFYTIDQFEANITESDADLSEVQSDGMPNGQDGNAPQMPNGQSGQDSTMPQMPNGQSGQDSTMPQMPNGQSGQDGTMPQMPGGQSGQDSTMPQIPNGQSGQDSTMPQIPNGQSGQDSTMPQMPNGQSGQDGTMPQMPGGGPQGQGGDGMISKDAVSIVDYINQRIANIKEQLNT